MESIIYPFICCLILAFLDVREWQKILPRAESPFAADLGLGALKAEYTRASWPSWTKVTIFGLLVGLVILLSFENPDLAILYLTFDGILILIALYMFPNWPSRSTRQVALFSDGIAWLEQGQIQKLGWQQIRATRTNYRYTVETTDGQFVVFDRFLQRTDVGKAIRSATGGRKMRESATRTILLVILLAIIFLIAGFFVLAFLNSV